MSFVPKMLGCEFDSSIIARGNLEERPNVDELRIDM